VQSITRRVSFGLADRSAAPLEPIGLIGFAWTSLGPPHVHWIAPMIFSALVGIANVSNRPDTRVWMWTVHSGAA
jgi:hypothetical protein